MTNTLSDTLNATALRVREHIIRMAEGGGCFIGASLSCVEIMVYLYAQVIRRNGEDPHDPGRDYLFLSKGHDVPALYGTFPKWASSKPTGYPIIYLPAITSIGIPTDLSRAWNSTPVPLGIFLPLQLEWPWIVNFGEAATGSL
jgi:hypothetical protein